MNEIEQKLQEIEARANAATAGPWIIFNNLLPKIGQKGKQGFVATMGYPFEDKRELNAAFIAAARTDIPALVQALRRALDELERHGYWEMYRDQLLACSADIAKILSGTKACSPPERIETE